ncbi:hydroxyproline O-galactosyltransferase GALT6-like [Primulina eburnea]|uniref:hydroxyproline O-galactosyltransferase GALT6-like n=1 Tax=Primulina eburnea TaxID=1245227 RepID=UPI003C6C18F0
MGCHFSSSFTCFCFTIETRRNSSFWCKFNSIIIGLSSITLTLVVGNESGAASEQLCKLMGQHFLRLLDDEVGFRVDTVVPFRERLKILGRGECGLSAAERKLMHAYDDNCFEIEMGTTKGPKSNSLITLSRLRPIQAMMGLLAVYLILVSFEIPIILKTGLVLESPEGEPAVTFVSNPIIRTQNDHQFSRQDVESRVFFLPDRKMGEFRKISVLIFDDNEYDGISKDEFSELDRVARDAFVLGKKLLKDLESGKFLLEAENRIPKKDAEPCPNSALLPGDDFVNKGKLIVITCGLSLGSHVTVVGMPQGAQMVNNSKIAMVTEGRENTMVSQFIMEFQGLSDVDGEDPPRILHFNPRL